MQNYLRNRKQRTKSKSGISYSTWEEVLTGVSHSSIFGPLLFDIFLCDNFNENDNHFFTNYEGDTTS